MFVFILKFLTFVNIYFYKVNVPVTVNIAKVSVPQVVVVLVPGDTAKAAGLQAVGILNTAIPEPPAPPVLDDLLAPPPPPVLVVPDVPVSPPTSAPSPPPPAPPVPPFVGCPPAPPPANHLPGAGPGVP
jgi:hypothetical protein